MWTALDRMHGVESGGNRKPPLPDVQHVKPSQSKVFPDTRIQPADYAGLRKCQITSRVVSKAGQCLSLDEQHKLLFTGAQGEFKRVGWPETTWG